VSYRLKQVDFDGTSTLSTTVDVTVGVFDYHLYQNYPNPYNPSTNIFFDLKEDGMVNLVVYNSIGEKVSEPVNGFMNKGIHKVRFEAMDLPAGVYFYRLSVAGLNGVHAFSQTKKMILAK
ncbi:MAG: T9SS type A sorting domain-containing protein, partial [Ignavibacteriaceae bacterium]|nr:T9SS type A sorting domain-containing protein [Ignavibacteriaceae bacterium]